MKMTAVLIKGVHLDTDICKPENSRDTKVSCLQTKDAKRLHLLGEKHSSSQSQKESV